MLRRYFNEDDFQDEYRDDDEDHNLGGEEGEFIHYIGKDDLLNSIQDMEMFEMNFNAKVLKIAVNLSKDSWFWNFRSIKKKAEIVKKAYDLLSKILTPHESLLDSDDDDIDLMGD